jgi:cytochrome c5
VLRVRGHKLWYGFLLVSIASLAFSPPRVQGTERSGSEVVDSVCAKCHSEGTEGAPKLGDREAWSARAAQGLSSLTANALEGIRKMPAHGGDPQLSDLEIARAITYMVNQSGGNWIEPASESDLSRERGGEQVVKTQCSKCHQEGVGGAPKIGDLDAWVTRMRHGLPYLVSSAIRGHGGMPPRGGQANLTDAELRSAILYMYNPAGMPAGKTSGTGKAVAMPPKDPNHKSVAGIDIHLGFVSAKHLRALPKGSPERAMHGGIPKGPGYYHVNVSLLDESSHAPIGDAEVEMEFDWPGLSRPPIELEPMLVGGAAGSYGNYVKPESGASYVVTLRIKRPGSEETVEAKFEHAFE